MTKGETRRPSSKTRLRKLFKAVALYRKPSSGEDLNLMDSITARKERLQSRSPDWQRLQCKGSINLGPVTFARAETWRFDEQKAPEDKDLLQAVAAESALGDAASPLSNYVNAELADAESIYYNLLDPDTCLDNNEQPLSEHLQIRPPDFDLPQLFGNRARARADTEHPYLPFASEFASNFAALPAWSSSSIIFSATLRYYEHLMPPRSSPSLNPSRREPTYYQATG